MAETRIASPAEEEVLTLRGRVRKLTSELANANQEIADQYNLIGRLSKRLEDVANVLHGGPMENGLWSFHDLPELAEQLLKDKKYFETLAIDRGWQLDATRES